jgi:hypothetical protein
MLFYAVVVAPIVAGILSSCLGTAAVAFDFGAVMLAVCLPTYGAFNRVAARATLAS